MYQSRAQLTKKIPIPRKGTKYVARSFVDLQNSIPVVVAVREMLKLARTKKEVKKMINQKLLKINGKEVKEVRDSIRLFNIFSADKDYVLTLKTSGRFTLEETKHAKERICKLINKKLISGGKIQLNFHDGTNIITDKKINIHDTVLLDFSLKITGHIPFEKGKSCFVTSGKYVGQKGKIESVEDGKAKIKLENNDLSVTLEKQMVVVI